MITANAQCRICRRQGIKLFLKSDRCLSPKCEIIRRNAAPGPKRKRTRRGLSEYGKELSEKQRLRNWYNLREVEFKKYVKKVLQKKNSGQDPTDLLIGALESRLDNVVFRAGFAQSRGKARQLVSHGYFLVNNKLVNIPSFKVRKGEVVSFSPTKAKKAIVQSLKAPLKKYKAPGWLQLDAENLQAKAVGLPTFQEASLPVDIQAIFEFYSR